MQASGVFDKIVDAAKGAAKKRADAVKAGDQETESLGKELRARRDMTADAMGEPTQPVKPVAPVTSPKDKVGGKPYGDRPGEKRIDVSDMVKPLGSTPVYDKGGKVNVRDGKHQLAILKHGERVLTEKQNEKYEKSNPAENAMEMKIYDKGGKVAGSPFDMITKAKAPKKEIKEMVHTKSDNGKHIVTHRHHSPAHHRDEIHSFDSMDEVKAHMDKHAGGEEQEGAAPMTAGPSPMPEAPAPGAAPAGM